MPRKKGFLWFIYHHPLGYPFLLLFHMRWFSQCMGWIFRSPLSKYLIAPLVRWHAVSLESFAVPAGGFRTLNDFFVRLSREGERTFPAESDTLGSPVDGCLEVFQNISSQDTMMVKGYSLQLEEIFSSDISDFIGGDLCFCRLRFSDYHRFHFFDDGEVLASSARSGPLYAVDASVLDTGLWIHNKSHLMRLRTQHFGEVLWLEVGATNVGSITNHLVSGQVFQRGAEKGYFALGGSAVLLVFQKDTIQWSESLLQKSLQKEEQEVKVGDVIGSKKLV